ncbi:hypothetical protein J421_5360 (plasmid) [Gemmatirosa kalamazoonensis]|uniref:Uncharacterized protein n=1 Tax=Gemmatirosa kalamazoonensis TaxID=861299 RepID=W0RRF1_9BACT|nr:hypothetical protein J421_5360 [Gemmatirosa kalamazoonensis]
MLAGIWAALTAALVPLAWFGVEAFWQGAVQGPTPASPVPPGTGGGIVLTLAAGLGEALALALPTLVALGALALFALPLALAWLALPPVRRGSFQWLALAGVALGALAVTSPAPAAPWAQVVLFIAPAVISAGVLHTLVTELVARAAAPTSAPPGV